MFETVRQLIKEPFISFEDYFQQYVMKVQDDVIDQEISFLLRNNFLSANAVMKLVNREIEDLK